MVVFMSYGKNILDVGLVAPRDTGKDAAQLVIESLLGTLVAVSNIFVITIMIAGRWKLMKNNFYIIVANLIVFTSLKAFVELGFILPYYIMRNDWKHAHKPFSGMYEYAIFNLSIFADYGVLFCSILIAANRLIAVTRKEIAKASRRPTVVACMIVWIFAAVIPIIYFFCNCQYAYHYTRQFYYNKCTVPLVESFRAIGIVLNSLIYLSYSCIVITMTFYVLIFIFLRRKRRNSLSSEKKRTSIEMRLIRQSVLVFVLYSASSALVLILPFISPPAVSISDIAYAENLLNLSIAAIYPICFLTMSGEMKSALISKIMPARRDRVASVISLNNKNKNNNVNNIAIVMDTK